jgi:hypothetical protein
LTPLRIIVCLATTRLLGTASLALVLRDLVLFTSRLHLPISTDDFPKKRFERQGRNDFPGSIPALSDAAEPALIFTLLMELSSKFKLELDSEPALSRGLTISPNLPKAASELPALFISEATRIGSPTRPPTSVSSRTRSPKAAGCSTRPQSPQPCHRLRHTASPFQLMHPSSSTVSTIHPSARRTQTASLHPSPSWPTTNSTWWAR